MNWQSGLGAGLGTLFAGPVGGYLGWQAGESLPDFINVIRTAINGKPQQKFDSVEKPYSTANDVLLAIENGDISAMQGYDIISKHFASSLVLNPNLMKMLNQLIARENTGQAQDFEKYLMQNNLLWNASQLRQLGLSNSGVLSTGSSVPNVAAASTDFSNPAQQNVQALSGLANNFIGMAGRMASAGIYGNAIRAVRGTAARVASQSAHSAYAAARSVYKNPNHNMTWDQMIDDMDK